jgi:hypothetical protein
MGGRGPDAPARVMEPDSSIACGASIQPPANRDHLSSILNRICFL